MTATRLYFSLIAASLRAQMQYRASFIMMSCGHFAVTAVEMVGIAFLFQRFERLIDWSLAEVALFYGVVHAAFALGEGLGRGFDMFSTMVREGGFDRVLVRPRSPAFQIASQEWQLTRVGRFLQAIIILTWASAHLELVWSPTRLLLVLSAIAGTFCLFYSLFVMQAAMTFWTTETLELMNMLTYGGTETAQFPLSIYRDWFRKFFTFVVPLACVTYFPLLAVLGRQDQIFGAPTWIGWLTPLAGVVFLALAFSFWRLGVSRYTSTGS